MTGVSAHTCGSSQVPDSYNTVDGSGCEQIVSPARSLHVHGGMRKSNAVNASLVRRFQLPSELARRDVQDMQSTVGGGSEDERTVN